MDDFISEAEEKAAKKEPLKIAVFKNLYRVSLLIYLPVFTLLHLAHSEIIACDAIVSSFRVIFTLITLLLSIIACAISFYKPKLGLIYIIYMIAAICYVFIKSRQDWITVLSLIILSIVNIKFYVFYIVFTFLQRKIE